MPSAEEQTKIDTAIKLLQSVIEAKHESLDDFLRLVLDAISSVSQDDPEAVTALMFMTSKDATNRYFFNVYDNKDVEKCDWINVIIQLHRLGNTLLSRFSTKPNDQPTQSEKKE